MDRYVAAIASNERSHADRFPSRLTATSGLLTATPRVCVQFMETHKTRPVPNRAATAIAMLCTYLSHMAVDAESLFVKNGMVIDSRSRRYGTTRDTQLLMARLRVANLAAGAR